VSDESNPIEFDKEQIEEGSGKGHYSMKTFSLLDHADASRKRPGNRISHACAGACFLGENPMHEGCL